MFKKFIRTLAILAIGIGVLAAGPAFLSARNAVNGLIPPDEGNGMVYVIRETNGTVVLYDNPFNIYLDRQMGENRIGYLHERQHLYFQVQPGKHELVSVGKNTKTIQFDISAGETVFIELNEQVDNLSGSDQAPPEILNPEAGAYKFQHTAKGWLDSEHRRPEN